MRNKKKDKSWVGNLISLLVNALALLLIFIFTIKTTDGKKTIKITIPPQLEEPKEVRPPLFDPNAGGSPSTNTNVLITEQEPINIPTTIVNDTAITPAPQNSGAIGERGQGTGTGSGIGDGKNIGIQYGPKIKNLGIIEKALNWLSQKQVPDGTWGSKGWLTGLVTLAFHSYNHSINSKKYSSHMKKSLKWLKQFLAKNPYYDGAGFAYAVSSYALLEAFLYTKNANLSQQVIKSYEFFTERMNKLGGFAYFYYKDQQFPIKTTEYEFKTFDSKILEQAHILESFNPWVNKPERPHKKNVVDLVLSSWIFQFLLEYHKTKTSSKQLNQQLKAVAKYINRARYNPVSVKLKRNKTLGGNSQIKDISFYYQVTDSHKAFIKALSSPSTLRVTGGYLSSKLLQTTKMATLKSIIRGSIKTTLQKDIEIYSSPLNNSHSSFNFFSYYASKLIANAPEGILKKEQQVLWEETILKNFTSYAKQTPELAYWDIIPGDAAFPINITALDSTIYATALNVLALTVSSRKKLEKSFTIEDYKEIPLHESNRFVIKNK